MGNLKTYYLLVNVSDQNSLQDLDYIKIIFKTPDCAFADEKCYYEITYNISTGGTSINPSSSELTASVIAPPLSDINGVFNFTLTFPKIAKHLGAYNWSIYVEVKDKSGNSNTISLTNLFDFAYYAEFEITDVVDFGTVAANNYATANSWINITAINANTNITIYTNHTYMLNYYTDASVIEWPLTNNLNITVNGITRTITQNVTISLAGPARNINYKLNWTLYVPPGIPSGKYKFYYFVRLEPT